MHEIKLPEDDAELVGLMLDYLYSGTIQTATGLENDDNANLMSDLYIMAEKYQLEVLKSLAIGKLGLFTDYLRNTSLVFDIAMKIYDNTPESDTIYSTFFKEVVIKMLSQKNSSSELQEIIQEYIPRGGKLAADIFAAHCYVLLKERAAEAALVTSLVKKTEKLNGQLEASTANIKIAKKTHKANHPDCPTCLRNHV